MKTDTVIDVDLILTFIHNAVKITSSRLSDEFVCKYFNHGAEFAEKCLRNTYPENTYNIDDIIKKTDSYPVKPHVILQYDIEKLGFIYVIGLFAQSIDLKVVSP